MMHVSSEGIRTCIIILDVMFCEHGLDIRRTLLYVIQNITRILLCYIHSEQ